MSDIKTLNALFHGSAARHGDRVALRYKQAKKFLDITYKELAERVYRVASGMAALGVERGDRVALLSENRPEWAITDLAILSIGGVVVPLYPTLPPPQVAYILKNSGAKALVVSDAKQLKKALEVRADLPDLKLLVAMEPGPASDDDGVQTFASIEELGKQKPLGDAEFKARWEGVGPDDLASIVYTSGTTGDPKGAMLTHGNITVNVQMAIEHFRRCGEPITETDTFLSFLPLCHVFERTTGYYLPLSVGGTIGYCEGVRTIMDDMNAVQPTLMVCVPRVYEAMQERIQDGIQKLPAQRKDMALKAIAAGEAYQQTRREGRVPGPVAWAQHLIFDKLVYSKMRERFGGRLRFFVSGGAALNPETAKFFFSLGMPIIEGYGMTETAPVMAVNPNRKPKLGTVGTVLPGGEVKIAGDGEILFKGPNVMPGYWKNEEATRDMIDADGWLHTGDVGIVDDEGYLKITDRKKDILVLVNGKKVAPQPIESELKQSPFINEAVLIGDKQNVVTALVLPAMGKLTEWAKEQSLTYADNDALLALPEVKKKIKQEIDAHSKHLADFEKIKKFTLLNATFSVDTGEMTPTLKVKRKVVAQKYAREIAAMGGEAAEAA
jgi:long-chain acyl-CoA synthetase